ncbi:probable polygalacturonase At3g15720 [Nicotiana tomentosiformis]|uniref:probable polygalacturonase At3g15720 n=1 Tax=Nicotiana tomentosiformis TaxID=4098 RepID=UPI00388C6DF6
MKKHIVEYVARCLNCQQVKYEHQQPGGLFQMLDIPQWKWERITMDFDVGIPWTQRKFDEVWDRVSNFLVFVTSFILHQGLAAIFDVTTYGAIGDGVTDDSQAFQQAWLDVCYDCENPTFLLSPILFQGPCNSTTINIQVLGNITAPQNLREWVGCENDSWLYFTGISGLIINGTGQINGQGAAWWNISGPAQKVNGTCHKPTTMHFNFCNDLELSGLNLVNSSRNHISITFSTGVNISNITITAPEDSPNTDGIDLSMSTTQVQILNSTFQTGDDCISINTGCSDINITGISCGPGHGIR